MPKREEIEAELPGARYFSRLDANSGFHQIFIDEATLKIGAFGAPFGCYSLLRLSFRISSAPEAFQNTLSEIFDRDPGVRVCVDDVLILGATKAEHDARLRNALQLASQAGVTFIPAKCKFALQEVEFLGDVISQNGIGRNIALSLSLAEMPIPEDKGAAYRMLGVGNF